MSHPLTRRIAAAIAVSTVPAGLLLAGYLPRAHREATLIAEARSAQDAALPVTVTEAKLAPATVELSLPGNIVPLTEARLNARAEGYLVRRLVDIGDRVTAGQLLAQIDTPELDQQVSQANAALAQAHATLRTSRANLVRDQAYAKIAGLTADRYRQLLTPGAVSRQLYDEAEASYQAKLADTTADEAAIKNAEDAIGVAEASLKRFQELQKFKEVRAPFAGVITARDVDVGALISPTGTGREMFRLAEIGTLRIVVDVPQSNVTGVSTGQSADIAVAELPARTFKGRVSRTASALSDASRTMRVEVQVENRDLALLPGMYAQVKFTALRGAPPVLVPGEALVFRPTGPEVAEVTPAGTVHFTPVKLGRDLGTAVEVTDGLSAHARIVVSPPDDVREGRKVAATRS